MRISDEDIRKVREAADIATVVGERVVLRRKNRLLWGCCPFHHEKTPSFKVDPATQLWHCFGCGEGGDVIGFVMKADNMTFLDAVRYLADRFNVEITEVANTTPRGERSRLYDLCDEAANFYHTTLLRSKEKGAAFARSYLTNRSIHTLDAQLWKLGYATGRGTLCAHLSSLGYTQKEIIDANLGIIGANGILRDRFYERIMFPIRDLQGRCVAFGGRVIGSGEPKYLNSQETPIFHKSSNMYGIDAAKKHIIETKTAIVVEGYTDLIAMHKVGKKNAVATLGTALTIQHIRLLSRFASTIIYLFDGDEAGMRAADRAVEFIDSTLTPEQGKSQIELKVVVLPNGQDPADFVRNHTLEEMETQLNSALPLLRFSIDRRLAKYDLNRAEEKNAALQEAVSVLAPVKESLLASEYANYIADRLLTDVSIVRSALDRANVRRDFDYEFAETDASAASHSLVSIPLENKAECDVLALLIANPELVSFYRNDLKEISWVDPRAQAIASILISAEEGVSSTTLVSNASAAHQEATAYLAQATIEIAPKETPSNIAARTLQSLRKRDLTRKIKVAQLRFAELENQDSPEAAELFKSISEWQKQANLL